MPLPHPRLPLSLLSLGLALHCPNATAEDSVVLAPLQVSDTYGDESYQALEASVGGFQAAPLLDTPATISVFDRPLIDDRQVRLLSEVLHSDASVGESYAPIGYYENFNVRGFELNAASSYRINGQTIAGEQNVALENKQQVELLKGLSGLQSGVSEPGGLINYVTKRPEEVRSVTVSTNEQGERYLATDLGGWFGSERQFGLRANLATRISAHTSTTPTASATSPRWRSTGRSAPMPRCSSMPSTSTVSSARCPVINCSAGLPCPTTSTLRIAWPTSIGRNLCRTTR
ncbi:hypothetical protein GCM10011247_45390 [Pseudomonas plecoglossicida]|nr:hypothetical protein GCM10011247_45390 [Pseudomonas plecoglossicida]